MSVTFDDILKQISKQARDKNDHRKRTLAWYREKAKEIRTAAKKIDPKDVDPAFIMKSNSDLLSRKSTLSEMMIGRLMMYYYDPKHKKTLPYYDTFPLIFPIELKKDGFLGINIHYLPPNARAILFGNLMYQLLDKKDEDKLNISYQILKGASRLKLFKPCIKRYLYPHVRSRFLIVDPKEWHAAVMLPTAQFEKASEMTVWEEVMKQFRN